MRTDELDFDLPGELIAQEPPPERSAARMLCYDRHTNANRHRHVRDLPDLLRAGDLLVFNDTAVVPARFTLRKPTGGLVEGLWVAGRDTRWQVLLKGLGATWPSAPLTFADDANVTVRIIRKLPSDGYDVACSEDAADVLQRLGRMPLPPYIKRAKGHDARDDLDRERYQTVLATEPTSVAAPTAGLHFTPELLDALATKGVRRTAVQLSVGLGTFKTVEADDLDNHAMHREGWHLPAETAEAINATRAAGGRVVAVGTTTCRVLESQPPGEIRSGEGETDLLIQPPYRFKHIDALLTNFHLPRSTLIALVDAFVGTDQRRRLYAEAIRERYRFFSYGDCMFVE